PRTHRLPTGPRAHRARPSRTEGRGHSSTPPMTSALPFIRPMRCVHAHAMHPQADLALSLVWAQLSAQGVETMGATLGWCYLTEARAPQIDAVLAGLRERLPGGAWVGGGGRGML